MSVLDTLVIDRTQADVARTSELARKINRGEATAEEIAEYPVVLEKGSYTATVLNRVGSAMLYCELILNDAGIAVALVNVKTNWSNTDLSTDSQMQNYLENLTALKTALNSPTYFPQLPSGMSGLNYDSANRIEMLLKEIELELERIYAAMVTCNQFNLFCGGFTLPVGGD